MKKNREHYSVSNGPVYVENNALQAPTPMLLDGGTGASVTNTGTECQGTSGILNGSYLLTGTYRANYLGLRGAEIA